MKPKFQLFHYLIAFVLVAVTAVTTVLIMQSTQDKGKDESKGYFYIDPNARDIDESAFEQNETSGQFNNVTISGKQHLFIEDGLLLPSPLLCNTNKNLLMQISFEYDGHQFYKTGLIPSMKGIADIELLKHFQPGIYDIILTYEFFTAINQKATSSIMINVKLVVE